MPEVDDRFASFAFGRHELWTLGVAFLLTAILQVAPVLQSRAALPLLGLLSCLCWTTPLTAFYFIAASQSLPFPEASLLNPTQMGFLTFPLVVLSRQRRFQLKNLSVLWVLMPFLLWYALVGGEGLSFFSYHSNFLRAIAYAIIACHFLNASGGQYLKCLMGLCLGAVTVGLAFWFQLAGLPVDLFTYGGPVAQRGGYTRFGGARADAVAAWPPLLMGAFGMIGIAVSSLGLGVTRRHTRRLMRLALVVFAFMVPPLLGTMTNAAYFGFAIMAVATAVIIWHGTVRTRFSLAAKRRLASVVFAGMLVAALLYHFDVVQVRGRLAGLWGYYSEARKETSMAASRTDVWNSSIHTIRQSPLLGMHVTGVKEIIPDEYASDGSYSSHNVFLEYGRHAGLPGMVLIAFFFFHPLLSLVRRNAPPRYLAFYIAYVVMFIQWMVLSYQFYKTFWALWMLMSMAAREGMRRTARVRAAAGG